jgi:outer membrane protein assembly factor BamA
MTRIDPQVRVGSASWGISAHGRIAHGAWASMTCVAFAYVVACASAPIDQDVVSALDIRGGAVGEEPELAKGLATREDDVFDGDVLEKDLERIRRYYRAQGYYEAIVRAARVVRVGPQKVRVEIDVNPGAPVVVSKLDIVAIEAVSAELAREIRKLVKPRLARPIVEKRLHEDARDIERLLADRGYAFARVAERAVVSEAQRTAQVEYRLEPGPKSVYGDVRIDGLGTLDREVVLARLGIRRGEPYSRRELEVARRRLFRLGVFSAVEVTPNLDDPGNREVPIRVFTGVGTLQSVHLGALVEADTVRGVAGLRVGWESRNFLGGLRRFTADATPGLALYPLSTTEVGLKVLPGVLSTFRLEQPAFIDPPTTGFIEGNLNVYPVLYSEFSPGDNIIGFQEVKGSVGVERPIAGETLRVRPSYNAQASFPFMYLGDKPEGLDTLVVLFPELVAEADLRDDPLEPRRGAYFRLSAQLAGLVVGDAEDLRLEPEVRLYAKLGRSVSVAFRGEVGLLFPDKCGGDPSRGCYGDSLTRDSTLPANDPGVVRDQQILLFRGFYSGGASSNRGYNLREVGPHGTLGFLVPTNVNCAVPNPPESCIRPLGGLTLWEQSLELRLILSKLAGVVFFVDASDVTREVVSFRLNFPHLSVGSGFRLRTPVGAARLDLGVRVPYMQEVGQAKLPPEEGEPGTFLGAPIAFHFGLGEAF